MAALPSTADDPGPRTPGSAAPPGSALLASPAVLAGYAPPPGAYDEYLRPDGRPREHVRPFLDGLAALGPQELARRWQQAGRMLLENGITHNAHDDPQNRSRPWRLDGVPMLLDAEEWEAVAAGLRQRADLLNLVLKDCYGPQHLLKRGLLPPDLLFSHTGFERPLHGQDVPADLYLHFYAADLARSPDGLWWIAGDRTENPGGAGYALENRIVTSRVLGEAFHDGQVQRLASYFLALRDRLKSLAPHRENPYIVLLTSGPGTTSFFEDVYLARYLGFTLVQGGDLGVRDEKVVLKTLGGLVPVDVILRRVHSWLCDPLELTADSGVGVPGLLQAVRKKNVVLANALGSGLVQAPALMAFLRPLCRALLGEDLKIPSVATWWCGGPRECEYVLSHLDRLLIRDAFRRRRDDPIRPWLLGRAERERLVAAIRARPHQYVGQEAVARSTAPVWVGGRCEPWHVALRTFLVASGDGYVVMPGGLTRVSPSAEPLDVSVSAGEGSKDIWMRSREPVRPLSLLRPRSERIELRRSGSELPSRVADNLFWLGRNAARADGAARLLRTLITRLSNDAEAEEFPERPLLLRCAAALGQLDYEYINAPAEVVERLLPAAATDEHRPMGLRAQLLTLQRTAWTVRDRLSLDAWRTVSHLAADFGDFGESPSAVELLPRLNRVVLDLAAFSGLVAESMTRSQGWRFLDIGRRLEHASYITRLLSAAAPDLGREEAAVLESLLEAADSLMTYRSRYLANLQAPAVLDLILTDDTNPRSVAFQLEALVRHISNLPKGDTQAGLRIEQRQVMNLQHQVLMFDVMTLAGDPGRTGALVDVLRQLSFGLPELSDAITHRYLHHTDPSTQFSAIRPTDPGDGDDPTDEPEAAPPR